LVARRRGVERAARLVLLGEAEQERVQVRAFLLAERGEEVILDLLRERSQPPQHPLAIAGEADEVSAAVVRIATALDQPALLELVEESDQLAPVVAQRVGDRALRLSRSEEHTSELQSRGHLVCRLLLEKKNKSAYRDL